MVGKTQNKWFKVGATKIVDSLISTAIDSSANFIHIEPTKNDMTVRFRINGTLEEVDHIPKNRYISVVERLKVLANLNVRERHVPQDGRFKTSLGDSIYSLRVSMIPTVNGEKITINIQNESSDIPSLKELGLWGNSLASMETALAKRSGVITVTGPTDSGKSLTMLSLLGGVDSSKRSIATIEDPIEYELKNASQTKVNPKANLTFLSGLKAILKHDTNIIMVSEFRDSPTIQLAFDAAMRGRLVVGSMYVDNSINVIERLRIATLTPSLVAHTLKLATSQRLVRKLCQDCKEAYEPDKLTLIKIQEFFLESINVKPKWLHELEVQYMSGQSDKKLSVKDLGSTEDKIKKLWRPHPGGCKSCNQTGYTGRTGLFEAMVVSDSIQKLIVGHASEKLIIDQAIKEGFVTLQVDGLIKALAGVTALDEVIRFGLEDIV